MQKYPTMAMHAKLISTEHQGNEVGFDIDRKLNMMSFPV